MTADLLSRLQELTAPDREVDAQVHALAIGGRVHFIDDGDAVIERPIDGMWIRGIYPLKGKTIPRYTASLDAAIALCERVLPGWTGFVDFGGGTPSIANLVGPPKEEGEDFEGNPVEVRDDAQGEGPTPAIALLIAILTAMEARDARD